MSDERPQLREKQIGQLAFYIANPKCLDLSDPGTGKTPPVCLYSYMMWARGERKTLWSMPKSLLKKNLKELCRFTDFTVANDKKYTPGDDVVIMHTDRANMTADWTGPTIASTRKRRGFKCYLPGAEQLTDTVELRDLAGVPVKFGYLKLLPCLYGPPSPSWRQLNDSGDHIRKPKDWVEVVPLLGPDDKPQQMVKLEDELFKDLIEAAAQDGAKVFVCTFSFMSTHWERLLKAAPSIDLLLVDELHMGYGGCDSKQTESFFFVNKHVSRFVGMTGTLIDGKLDSAFPAIHVICPEYYGSRMGFIYEHAAAMDDYGRVVMWKNHEKLKQIIKKHSIRRTFEEVYGKEDVVFFTEEIEMHEKVREQYDLFHDQAMLELNDGRVLDGSMAGVAQIRARQIMGHPETMLDGIPKWTEKDERLAVHLAKGKKTLVFAALQPEQSRILRLCEELGLRAELINANVSGARRVAIDEMAQRGELDVIVASGPTAAVGWNWEMFDLVVFCSIDFKDVNILQAYRRASRGTRTSTLHVVFLKYEDTVDDRMYDIVKKKSQEANLVDPTRRVLDFSS